MIYRLTESCKSYCFHTIKAKMLQPRRSVWTIFGKYSVPPFTTVEWSSLIHWCWGWPCDFTWPVRWLAVGTQVSVSNLFVSFKCVCLVLQWSIMIREEEPLPLYMKLRQTHVKWSWTELQSGAKPSWPSAWTRASKPTLSRWIILLWNCRPVRMRKMPLSFCVVFIRHYWSKKLTDKPWRTDCFIFIRDSQIILNLFAISVLEGKQLRTGHFQF